MKFTLTDVHAQNLFIDLLTVHSYEMNVYFVSLTVGTVTGKLYDNNDKPKRFYSAQQIREAFEHCNVARAEMVQDMPYDEMIGNPPSSSMQVPMPFSLAQPY